MTPIIRKTDWYNNPFVVASIIFLMTVSGLYLRIYNLDWQCLKVDETVTQVAALHSSEWIMRWALTTDYNPPLYYLAAHYSSMFFGGATAFAIRFPAALCSTALIPLSYLLGKTLKDNSLGYLMAGVAAFIFPYFYYAQDARAYPMVLMFFVAFLIVYVDVWNNGFNGLPKILIMGATIAGCLWSHYYVALPIFILMICLFHRFRGGPDTFFAGMSVIAAVVFLSPLIGMFDLTQFGTRTNHLVYTAVWNPPSLIALTVTNEMLCWSWVILIPLAIYAFWKYRREETVFLPFAATIILSTVFLIPMAHFTAVMPRYALVSTPMILLVALYPVSVWVESQPTIDEKYAMIALFLLVILAFNFGSIYQWLTFSICPMMNPGGI